MKKFRVTITEVESRVKTYDVYAENEVEAGEIYDSLEPDSSKVTDFEFDIDIKEAE